MRSNILKRFAATITMVAIIITSAACNRIEPDITEKITVSTSETTTSLMEATTKATEKVYDFTEGSEAMDFEVELLTGERVKLSDYRGKVVLLNFWATWCGYCLVEFPDFQRIQEEYGEDLIVFAVNCGEDKKKVENFIKDNKYTFTVGLDSKNEIKYPTSAIPLSFVIDKDGVISHKLLGAAEEPYDYFKAEIEKAGK